MVVGVLTFDLHLHGVQSLKGKRAILQKLLARCRNRFPVSCAEVDCQDLWQRAVVGCVLISSSEAQVASILERLESDVENSGLVEIIEASVEYIHL